MEVVLVFLDWDQRVGFRHCPQHRNLGLGDQDQSQSHHSRRLMFLDYGQGADYRNRFRAQCLGLQGNRQLDWEMEHWVDRWFGHLGRNHYRWVSFQKDAEPVRCSEPLKSCCLSPQLLGRSLHLRLLGCQHRC